jgi:GNAT superfamily N-acetyltransferase
MTRGMATLNERYTAKITTPERAARAIPPGRRILIGSGAAEPGVLVRPVRLSDEPAPQDLFYRLSDKSTYLRFMTYKRVFSHEEMQKLCDFDDVSNMALVVCTGEEHEDIVATARYDVDPSTGLADIGLVVLDAWQGKGIGTILLGRMVEIARARGLAGFSADVLFDNKTMLRLFQKSGMDVNLELTGGSYAVTARFERGAAPRPPDPPGPPSRSGSS